MVISSLVVETVPDCADTIMSKLPGVSGVEVHGVEGHKAVITIEAATVDESHDIANGIAGWTGVINVDLIYLNFEDDKTIYPEGV